MQLISCKSCSRSSYLPRFVVTVACTIWNYNLYLFTILIQQLVSSTMGTIIVIQPKLVYPTIGLHSDVGDNTQTSLTINIFVLTSWITTIIQLRRRRLKFRVVFHAKFLGRWIIQCIRFCNYNTCSNNNNNNQLQWMMKHDITRIQFLIGITQYNIDAKFMGINKFCSI